MLTPFLAAPLFPRALQLRRLLSWMSARGLAYPWLSSTAVQFATPRPSTLFVRPVLLASEMVWGLALGSVFATVSAAVAAVRLEVAEVASAVRSSTPGVSRDWAWERRYQTWLGRRNTSVARVWEPFLLICTLTAFVRMLKEGRPECIPAGIFFIAPHVITCLLMATSHASYLRWRPVLSSAVYLTRTSVKMLPPSGRFTYPAANKVSLDRPHNRYCITFQMMSS